MQSELDKIIGINLKQFRYINEYKMDYVSIKTGISKSKLSKIEKGLQQADNLSILILCKFYKISASNFWNIIETNFTPPLCTIYVKLENFKQQIVLFKRCSFLEYATFNTNWQKIGELTHDKKGNP